MDQTLNQYWEPMKSEERLDDSLFHWHHANKGKTTPLNFFLIYINLVVSVLYAFVLLFF